MAHVGEIGQPTAAMCMTMYTSCRQNCEDTPIPGPMLLDGVVSPIYEQTIALTSGSQTIIETRNVSGSSDPVLHLLDNTGREVAMDDNSNGGTSARISHTATASGNHMIVLRARDNSTRGTCDLFRNGNLLRAGIRFAGWKVRFEQLRPSEQIETVQLPNGPAEPHRLYVMHHSTQSIVRRIASGGTAGGTRYTAMAPGTVTFFVGARTTEGPGRILRNDAGLPGHDPDQDRLGSSLESWIGTCSRLTGSAKGFNCALAADPRDTDGDGISDGMEVLGRRDTLPHQPLPLWGADPRHKDLFFEVDFMLRDREDPALRMTPQQAREFARYYQDEIGLLTLEQSAAHASALKNPDGKRGIRVHLDTGVPPANATDATLYGNWGGYTAVPPVCDANGACKGADYAQAWRTQMTPARFGVFRYMLPYATGGGQNGPGYACASGLDSIRVLAHECGHALGLANHSQEPSNGPDVNCKPNYASLMNYAYLHLAGGPGFADGTGRLPLNNALLREWEAVPPSAKAYLHDLQDVFLYNVDFARGHVDWNRNGIFEPPGKWVRAYANYRANNECEYTKENEVQVGGALSERTPALARLGGRIYAFYIDRSTRTIRYRFSTSAWDCTTFNANCGSWQGGGAASSLSLGAIIGIDAAMIGNRIVLVAVAANGGLWQRELAVNSGNESWDNWQQVSDTVGASGEPAIESDGTRLVLVYRDTDRVIRFRTRGAGQPWSVSQSVLSNGQPLRTSEHASPGLGQGSLQLRPPGQPGTNGFYGAFPDSQGFLDIWYFDIPAGTWEKTNVLNPRMGPVEGRTALAYAPYLSCCNSTGGWNISSSGGEFYLYYVTRDGDGNPVAGMMMSHTPVNAGGTPGPQRIGLQSYYHNSWWCAYGLDAMADYYHSGSLFVLATLTNGELRIRPRSDGQLNYTYSNRNDWELLGRSLCGGLRSVGPLAPEPRITCVQ